MIHLPLKIEDFFHHYITFFAGSTMKMINLEPNLINIGGGFMLALFLPNFEILWVVGIN